MITLVTSEVQFSLYMLSVNPSNTTPCFKEPEEEAFSDHRGKRRQEDHDGPISLTWVLNSTG